MHRKFRLTRKKITFLTIFVAFGAIIFPNRAGILKAVGFWEADFIDSSSGAIYETNKPLGFVAKIGNSQNIQDYKLTITLGSDIEIRPTTNTPDSPEPTPVSTDMEIANQLDTLNQLVGEVVTDTTKITGSANRSFFGPYESVSLKTTAGESVSYYLQPNSLVESRQIVDRTDLVNYLLKNEKYSLNIDDNQNWIFTENDNPVLIITSTIITATKQTINLPTTTPTTYPKSENQIVALKLPSELLNEYTTNYPLTLVRKFSSPTSSYTNPTTAPDAILVGNPPTSIQATSEGYVFIDPKDQAVKIWRDAEAVTLLANVSATDLSCFQKRCFAVADNLVYRLNLGDNTTSDGINLGLPIGGISISGNDTLITENTNPTGKLIKFQNGFEQKVIISENYSFAQQIKTNSDQSTTALWANSQLNVIRDNQTQTINLPAKPYAIWVDDDDYVYLAVEYEKISSRALVRITPTNTLELAAKISGQISSVTSTPTQIVLGLDIPKSGGAIWPINKDQITWLNIFDFVQQ